MRALIRKHKHNIIGIVGMIILQSNQIPLIVQSYNGMPVSIYNALLVLVGLSFYLYYSVARADILYIVSNSIGITFSVILLLINL